FGGTRIRDTSHLRLLAGSTAPGTEVEIAVIRNGERITVTITLDELPLPDGTLGPEVQPGSGQGILQGLGLSDVTPQIREQLQMDEPGGALVTEVAPGSPAARAQIQPG